MTPDRAPSPRPTIERLYDTHVIARFSHVLKGLRGRPDCDLIVGQGSRVDGSVRGARNVYLGKGVRILGAVEATLDLVVGAGARVAGNASAGGDVILLDGALVEGNVHAGRNARLVGGRVVGPVVAKGDVEARSPARASAVDAQGRIRTGEAAEPDEPEPHL